MKRIDAPFGLICRIALVAVASVAAGSYGAAAQQAGGALQEKLAVMKEAAAANQQALRRYTWLETTRISLKGEVKSTKQESCLYRPDGTIQKTPVSPPQPQDQSGGRGRLRRRIVEKKKEELTDYMQQVKGLIGQYVPPDPNRMQQAYQSGNVFINPSPGLIRLAFKNYVQSGDSMTLSLDENTRKLSGLNVNSYLGEEKDAVTLSVQFGVLPDGTRYPAQVVVVATAKKIQVTVTNSNYQNLAAQ